MYIQINSTDVLVSVPLLEAVTLGFVVTDDVTDCEAVPVSVPLDDAVVLVLGVNDDVTVWVNVPLRDGV